MWTCTPHSESMPKRQCLQAAMGVACTSVTSHVLKSAHKETLIIIYGHFKKEWVEFYHCRLAVNTHCQPTFMSKRHAKVNFA